MWRSEIPQIQPRRNCYARRMPDRCSIIGGAKPIKSSGSYLPYQIKDLVNRGWTTARPSANSYETEHVRKSTGQHVLRHGRHLNKNGIVEPTHYHWKNPATAHLSKKKKQAVYYFDKFGTLCARGSVESHLKPHKTRRKKK